MPDTKTVPEPTFSWLIEDALAAKPSYYDGFGWTFDHGQAIRYAREIDAIRAITNLPHGWHLIGKAVEHGWHAAPAQPAHSQEGEPSIIKALRITAPGSKWMDVINYIDALLAQPREAKKELRFATKARDQYLEHCGHLTQRAEKAEAALQAARDEGRGVWIPNQLFLFLLGSGEVDGVGFGDKHPTIKGRYWWRRKLQECIKTDAALKTKAHPESGKGVTDEEKRFGTHGQRSGNSRPSGNAGRAGGEGDAGAVGDGP